MSTPKAKRDDALPNKILARLTEAGTSGLATSKLPGAGKYRKEVLDQLLADRRIGNLGTENKACYVLAEHYKPLELAAAHVEGKATAGRVTVYTLSKLEAGSAGEVRNQVRKAVETLTKQRVLLRIRPGKTDYWLHVASIRPLLEKEHTSTAELSPKSLAGAYARATKAVGFADIPIALLKRESGMELEPLHQALLELSRSGKAVLSLGDWSLSSEEERAGALCLDGRQYLQVRMLDQS